MRSIKEFFIAIGAYFNVLPFVFTNGIWSFFVLPLVLNFMLIAGLIYMIFYSVDNMSSYMGGKVIEWGLYNISGGSWIIKATFALITFLLTKGILLLQIFALWQFYQLLSLIFLTPLFSYLSEKIQEVLIGTKTKFSIGQFMKDVYRGIRIAIRNIFFQVLWIILTTFVLGTILPFLAFLLPLGLFLISAFYYGFTMIDYRSEYYHFSPKESRLFVNNHKGFALGNGVVFQFLLMIPIIGTLFAPSFALVAAALGLDKLKNVSKLNGETIEIEAVEIE